MGVLDVRMNGMLDREARRGRITRKEVEMALNKMKGGRSAGLDGIYVEMLKKRKKIVLKWLVRIFNVC